MKKIKAGIIGGAGYTGGELLRILLYHPDCEISFVHSKSNARKKVYTVHEDLYGECHLDFTDELHFDLDVLFMCSGHGESKKFLDEYVVPPQVRVIDLSQDHRVYSSRRDREFTYGLCELNRGLISKSNSIANPGCFATGIQLALLPLAKEGKLKADVHINGTTGSTGAGQAPSTTTHHSWRNNNHSIYKAFEHQHLSEIYKSVTALQPEFSSDLNFVPHRGSFARGIHSVVYTKTDLSKDQITELYYEYYLSHPFTHLIPADPTVKQVVNTNKCYLKVEKYQDNILITSVIDNLLKGASGQAVQNMNLMFGFEETTGLKLKASVF